MNNREKVVMSWSGGKDSALALHRVQKSGNFDVCYLLTILNGTYKRISMHGVREELLDAQASATGIPLIKIYVQEGTNSEYEEKMEDALLRFRDEGIQRIVFGDIFLEDLRAYRDNNMAKVGMSGFYPLWKEDTTELVGEFLREGFRTMTCCINDGHLGEHHVGRQIDEAFVSQLPGGVDPCGENGEFHTFVFQGPIFSKPIEISAGEKVYKPLEAFPVAEDHPPISPSRTKGFWYADLIRNVT